MLHSQESGSSVFFHSQEEGPGADGWSYAKDSELGFPSDRTPELLVVGGEPGRESDTDTGQSVCMGSLSYRTLVSLMRVQLCLWQLICCCQIKSL